MKIITVLLSLTLLLLLSGCFSALSKSGQAWSGSGSIPASAVAADVVTAPIQIPVFVVAAPFVVAGNKKRDHARAMYEERKAKEAERRKEVYDIIKIDPSQIVANGWYDYQKFGPEYIAVRDILMQENGSIPLHVLEQIYDAKRNSLVASQVNCTPEFLTRIFNDAEGENDISMLEAVALNRNCPREIVLAVIKNPKINPYTQKELEHRLTQYIYK